MRTTFLLLATVWLVCAFAACRAWTQEPVKDGFYAVVRVSRDRASLLPLAKDERIVKRSVLFQDAGEKPEYVVIRAEPYVPLTLKEKPEKTRDRTGRTKFWLQLHLTEDAAKKLETFTRDNLGKRATFVVGGESITMHGIRSVIKDGKMQISRCSDNA